MKKVIVIISCFFLTLSAHINAQIEPIYPSLVEAVELGTRKTNFSRDRLEITFDRPVKHLMFSIPPTALISTTKFSQKDVVHHIYGLSPTGEKIIPQYSIPTDDPSLIFIEDEMITQVSQLLKIWLSVRNI